jgi:hypothetical protein
MKNFQQVLGNLPFLKIIHMKFFEQVSDNFQFSETYSKNSWMTGQKPLNS